ncbi:hypothetical protein B296_00042171 [Ensete ventricosum]|uniref:Uncharacterized protein n=1 Tax=Ensete ventricosum TaxID=4639 RepID=A0A426XT29_ENSVE|nr:hypothetical protein B296_00042171 [Ensete ventricosum]
MRSATVNKTSVKLSILHKGRRRHLERQPGKKSHKERIITAETRLDVLEASVEELYQGQQRLLGVESSQKEVESRIEKVDSLIDQLTEDTKNSVRHLHEVVAELTAKVARVEIKRGTAAENVGERKKTAD